MKSSWVASAVILAGICAAPVHSWSQTYTVSAKPGAVNFIQGDVSVNGEAIWSSNLKSTFLNQNDLLTVKNGKAEVLLTPGVFLRIGADSEVRMVKPSLIETQIEIVSGESMLEVDDVVPGSSVVVLDHGAATTLVKTGLYRFTGRSIATLEGKAQVTFNGRTIDLKKNKEITLDDTLTVAKLDRSQGDDLYAWSNTRAQYNAAASYAGSRDAYNSGGYGVSSFSSPGWYWNSGFSGYMWMPGNGAFYSPFGWGFYGPGVVSYAPVIAVPGYGYGYYGGNRPTQTGTGAAGVTTLTGITRPPVTAKPVQASPMVVPVNPRNMGVANFQGTSPAAFEAARLQMQQSFGYSAMRTASGAPAANLRNGQTFSNMRSASQAAASSARATAGASSPGGSGGGWAGVSGGGGYSRGWSGSQAGEGSGAGRSAGPASHSSGGGSARSK